MKNRSTLLILCVSFSLVALFFSLQASGQYIWKTIDLNDDDPQNIPDNPFGIGVTPDGLHALVPICGDVFTANNNRVDVIDLSTYTVVKSVTVGYFPEDVAFTTTESGAVRHAYITNSSSGSISVLDAGFDPVDTIPLGSSTYPFGMAVSPDQALLYVGTVSGTGEIFVIDVDPESPNFHTVMDTLSVPGGHGRPAFYNPNHLVVPATVYDIPGYAWSEARIVVLDPADPGNQSTLFLSGQSSQYPSPQDVAVLSDGRAFVPVMGYNSYVYVVHVPSLTLADVIDLGPVAETLQHGICASPDERFVYVTSFVNNVVSIIQTDTHQVVKHLSVPGDPNEVAFTLDSSTALVTNQYAQAVSVIKGIPEGSLKLSGPTFPPAGTTFTLTLSGGRAGKGFGLFYSLQGLGSGSFGGISFHIADPIFFLRQGVLRKTGSFTTQKYLIPNNPEWRGFSVFFQGIAAGEAFPYSLSNVLTVIIQ